MRESLLDIGKRLKNSKWGGHTYLPIYDELFAPFRDEPITIVEFGIDQGNSLRMWLEYFSAARIIGVDSLVDNVTLANRLHPRISAHHHAQQEPEVGRIIKTFSPTIVVDDAGHDHNDQALCFGMVWPALCPGGIYCIEDVQTDAERHVWHERGFTIYANYTSSELADYRYDDVLAVLRK